MPFLSSSFLILSDIHFGSLAVSKDFALPLNPPKHPVHGAVPMKEALIATVKKHASKLSGILVPGDLTSTATPSEFRGSVEAVKRIVPSERVGFVLRVVGF